MSCSASTDRPVLTVTANPAVDVCLDVDRLHTDGKNRARVRSVQAGGGGINVARCLRRLGVPVRAVYVSGGETGHRLDRLLAEEGIAGTRVAVAGETREALVITETAAGHSYHIVPPGPMLGPAECARLLATVAAAACSYLVVTGSAPPGLPAGWTANLLDLVAPSGVPVILDIAGAQLRQALTRRAYLVRLDRREAAALIGAPIDSFGAARAANEHVLAAGAARYAITTVGALGAVLSGDDGTHVALGAPPLPGPARCDACAGDSFVAALVARLTAGAEPRAAARFGVAAAAATVAAPGTEVFRPATAESLFAAVTVRPLEPSVPH